MSFVLLWCFIIIKIILFIFQYDLVEIIGDSGISIEFTLYGIIFINFVLIAC